MAASSAFPLTPCCRSFVGIRDGTAPPTATFLALDPESQFWLHAATALCHMLLGIMTILIVIRLRYQANPNTGIFAVAAKLGIGSVTEARSDTTDPTVYISYPQTFDLVWILNILVVIIVALSLLGCGLERTHEGPRVTWFALVNVANVFWFYRALLAQVNWLRIWKTPLWKSQRWRLGVYFIIGIIALVLPIAGISINAKTGHNYVAAAITVVRSLAFLEASFMVPPLWGMSLPWQQKLFLYAAIAVCLLASLSSIIGSWWIAMLRPQPPLDGYLPVVSFVCLPDELLWDIHCLYRYLRPMRPEPPTHRLSGALGGPREYDSYHEAVTYFARTRRMTVSTTGDSTVCRSLIDMSKDLETREDGVGETEDWPSMESGEVVGIVQPPRLHAYAASRGHWEDDGCGHGRYYGDKS